MIKAKLPILRQEIKDDKLIDIESEVNIVIDTSVAAEIRYEEAFPKLAERISLYGYLENCQKITDTSTALTAIKALYPFIEFEQPTSFIDFCKMFNFSNADFFKKFISKLTSIFEMIYPKAKKNG